MSARFDSPDALKTARIGWLSILVRVPADDVIAAAETLNFSYTELKAPEVGLMMTQGRIHASGQPFRLGEVSLTRCVLQDDDGRLGYGQILGRNKSQALAIARLDLGLQRTDSAESIEQQLDVWRAEMAELDGMEQDAVQETRVNFFTLVRGEV